MHHALHKSIHPSRQAVNRFAEQRRTNPNMMEVEEVEEQVECFSTMEEENHQKTHKNKKRKNLQAKIQVLPKHSNKISPIVGYFPSGFNPLPEPKSETELESEREPPKVKVFRHEKKSGRLEVVVSPNGSNVDFVGTSYSGEAAMHQACSYALGVLDKETKTLKIVPIECDKIFRLEPRVRGSDSAEYEPPELSKTELTAEQKSDRMRELTQLYGTKKSIKQDKKLESLRQQEDPEMQEKLDEKLKQVRINKDALESATTPTARNIPQYDTSATTPQQAYPLDKIILKGEWDYLLDIFELLQAGSEVAPDVYPTFVRNRIHKLEDIQEEVEKKKLASIFSYITHLIKFKDQHSMDGVSSAKHHKIPSILRQKFFKMFADSTSKRLADDKNALLISYVLVLTLFADEFCTSPSDIAKDLRMSPIALRVHFEHLGCKLKREDNFLFATLPVPLQFPELRRRRRK